MVVPFRSEAMIYSKEHFVSFRSVLLIFLI